MKKLLMLVVLGSLLFSCKDDVPVPLKNVRYVHEIAGCDNTGNPEMSCTEFFELQDDGRAKILLGGGDIVEWASYEILGKRIVIQVHYNRILNLVFETQTDGSLLRLDNDTIWHLED